MAHPLLSKVETRHSSLSHLTLDFVQIRIIFNLQYIDLEDLSLFFFHVSLDCLLFRIVTHRFYYSSLSLNHEVYTLRQNVANKSYSFHILFLYTRCSVLFSYSFHFAFGFFWIRNYMWGEAQYFIILNDSNNQQTQMFIFIHAFHIKRKEKIWF
jgi:hypothetical protein